MKTSRILRTMACVVAVSMFAGAGHAQAADYPTRTVTLVVPSQPGGSIDFLGRLFSEPLSAALGVPVVIDNKPGASGNIGNMQVSRARPDGYTLLMAYNGFLVANPHLFKTGAIDPVRDLTPVAMVSRAPQILVATSKLPAQDLQGLIAYAREHPGKLNYASSGNGSVPHLAGELLQQRTGTSMAHIPYKGAGGAVVDLIAGQVDLYITSPAGVMQQIKAGQIKALAVTGENRLETIPDVPTAREAGLEDYDMDSWFALYAPAGTPPDVVARLNTEMNRIMSDPDIQRRAREAGMALYPETPSWLATFTTQQLRAWGDLVRTAGLSAQ